MLNPQEAIRIVGEMTELKFKEPEGKDEKGNPKWKETPLDGKMITDAHTQPNGNGGGWAVVVTFNAEGSKLFGDMTTKLVGQPIGIELDGKIISAPNVNEPITGGTASISGNFDAKSAQELSY